MIFLDANYFLRFWTKSDLPQTMARQAIAIALFARIDAGMVEATTSEAVLVEVSYVLASKRQYGLSPEVVIAYLTETLRMPGLKLPHGKKEQYLRALELWSERPALGFVDALTAAMVENSDNELATFDAHFDGMAGIDHWRPDNGYADDPVPPLPVSD
jgi:predicted nucleic acid-binding protein